MTREDLLGKLLESYRSSFDIETPYEFAGERYDAYAAFRVTSAKYVLVKKAELWRANCFEHVFFQSLETLDANAVERFRAQIAEQIEPQLVRGGKSCPEKDHMYTYLTGIFIVEQEVPEEVRRAVRKFSFTKNYRFTIRGYSEARVLVFDLARRKVFGNRAARELVKGYTKAGIFGPF